MGTLFVQTTGSAANSGSSDNNAADLTGTTAIFISGTTVQLDSGTVLTGVVTSGIGQSSINISGATNTNRTVFWITSVSGSGGATPQVTLDVAPTGMTTNAWKIGGRYLFPATTAQNVIVNALRAGDTLQFNDSPAAKTTVPFITSASAGDTTSGKISVIGKAGQTVTLATTGASSGITISNPNWYIGNLTVTNTSNNAIVNSTSTGFVIENCTVNGSGVNASQTGILITNSGYQVLNCNVGPVGGIGINQQSGSSNGLVFGNYVHGATSDGITMGSLTPSHTIINNIVTGNGGRGIFVSGATAAQGHMLTLYGNTVFGNTNSQVEVSNINTVVGMFNNIFSNASAANLAAWPSGGANLVSMHEYNVYFSSSSGANVNLTPGATEKTSDPVFSSTGSGNFAIGATGSAAGAGFPGTMPGALSAGFVSIGAVQPQAGSSGGFVVGM